MDLLKDPEVLQALEMVDQNRVEPDGRGGDSGGTLPPPSLGLTLGGRHNVWDRIEDGPVVERMVNQADFRTLDAEPEPSVLLERYVLYTTYLPTCA